MVLCVFSQLALPRPSETSTCKEDLSRLENVHGSSLQNFCLGRLYLDGTLTFGASHNCRFLLHIQNIHNYFLTPGVIF